MNKPKSVPKSHVSLSALSLMVPDVSMLAYSPFTFLSQHRHWTALLISLIPDEAGLEHSNEISFRLRDNEGEIDTEYKEPQWSG